MQETKPDLLQVLRHGPLRIAVIGSGNWGTAVGLLVAENAQESYMFHTTVPLWVHDEKQSDGRMLSQHINEDHINSKYLPGVTLPPNLVAESDLIKVVQDADLIIISLPHQFVLNVCDQMVGHIKPTARAITLVKGIYVADGLPQTFSEVISEKLGVECSALSGANVASDVAHKEFAEATIGYSEPGIAVIWQQVFDRPYFRISTLPDVNGVQLCGALKNVVAVAAGFCDGMNLGSNTKAAIIRIGMEEIRLFSLLFFSSILEETFFESAGVADLITTSYGGRNVRCAAVFAKREGKSSWHEIEAELLGGQKLQGPQTCAEIYKVLEFNDIVQMFPLFSITYRIAFQGGPCVSLINFFMEKQLAPTKPFAEYSLCPVPPKLMHLKACLHARQQSESVSKHSSHPKLAFEH
eukprot:Gregarina_sp_Poly_1__3278@NODE_1938_length_3041_cov_149_372562_g1249_i0_p2_GENE_NODE_1938_length_3041_cov_149_372562_g1249_i0NODE_1938_length_3041_cov_149_372562_g1249_i0_p2_ORF_typecomplete_len410_score56_77NAD_Gly3P_dh_N/PF01210_23/2_1e47NAD_Gly3P_dh_C/PF07479_14/6_2e45F420_oxidored/PF03807_17/0_0022ApbA/PF02558_16/0_0016Rossmannlike/PF10727_9/0_077Rossmannlike/PF10727_9/5_8e03IlvN/PF07991_12/0_1IlvN/PF07991_12/2e03UDPG_MGDP_dh_N/PF03721_14/0_073NAD_binding_2/PF03446_15/0_13_NODE_1938_length_3